MPSTLVPLADILAGPARVPRLARAILGVVLVGIGVAGLIASIQAALPPSRLAAVLVAIPVIVMIQVVFFGGQLHRGRPRATLIALIVQGTLVWGLMPVIGQAWLGQVGFLAGSLLLATPARVALPLTLVMLVLVGWIQWDSTGDRLSTLYAVDATVITGLVVFGVTTMARFVVELHTARADLASLAVAAERDRFARDLHDLLGFSLSAITLKSELAKAVVVEDPQRAQEELAELGDISRQALKDVRRVAHGGGEERTLEQEIDSAAALVRAAGIDVRVDRDSTATTEIVDEVVGAVLREAVTNVLRHSRATHCHLRLHVTDTIIALGVDNDGVQEDDAAASVHGGLRNMQERTTARGGSWRGAREGTWFRVEITVPTQSHSRNAVTEPT